MRVLVVDDDLVSARNDIVERLAPFRLRSGRGLRRPARPSNSVAALAWYRLVEISDWQMPNIERPWICAVRFANVAGAEVTSISFC